MTLAMIGQAFPTSTASGTDGCGESARYIEEQIDNIRQKDLQRPEFYFPVMKEVLPDLMEVKSETAEAGWDGYNACAIRSETFDRSVEFLESLPNTVATPTVSAEPDGHITLEWYRSPHRVLSVSVSPEGDLHYAALIGPNKAYGTEVFFGESPRVILDLIHRVSVA